MTGLDAIDLSARLNVIGARARPDYICHGPGIGRFCSFSGLTKRLRAGMDRLLISARSVLNSLPDHHLMIVLAPASSTDDGTDAPHGQFEGAFAEWICLVTGKGSGGARSHAYVLKPNSAV